MPQGLVRTSPVPAAVTHGGGLNDSEAMWPVVSSYPKTLPEGSLQPQMVTGPPKKSFKSRPRQQHYNFHEIDESIDVRSSP